MDLKLKYSLPEIIRKEKEESKFVTEFEVSDIDGKQVPKKVEKSIKFAPKTYQQLPTK